MTGINVANRLQQFPSHRIFKQIALCSRLQCAVNIRIALIGREDNDAGSRKLSTNLNRCFDAAHSRHSQVHHHHIGLELAILLDGRFAVPGLSHTGYVLLPLNYRRYSLAHNGVVVHEYLQACSSRRKEAATSSRITHHASSTTGDQSLLTSAATKKEEGKLQDAILAILDGYSRGTRFGIRMDSDGLLAAGERGVQLTWMDAKVGEWVVTPRAGKPVEIQALWLNALKIAAQFSPGWQEHFERGLKSFEEKFWNDQRGCLFDVIDVNHRAGEVDAAFRPNQIFTVGGLPFQLLEGDQARKVVAQVEEKLLTPLGLRSLAPSEPDYKPQYQGGVVQRDGSYHQGTVWPWLIGPFVEAWVRVRGNNTAVKREAREKFLTPLLGHLEEAGLGHISEIADAERPHTPRGCPFQAWSVGEALRLDLVVLAEREETGTSVRFTARKMKSSRTPITALPKKIEAISRPRATRSRNAVAV